MRHRPKTWADSELAENPHFLPNPMEHFGGWAELFGNNNPIHLEIGCGKGGFLIQSAIQNPGINFIGLEKEDIIISMAVRRAREQGQPPNLYFTCANAHWLSECFDAGELGRIYLNFSDPWRSRGKWRKRRLTHSSFLDTYASLMHTPEIYFKTDDAALFRFSITELEESGWMLGKVTFDLHNSDYAADNILTEYEHKFASQGKPICRLEARKINNNPPTPSES